MSPGQARGAARRRWSAAAKVVAWAGLVAMVAVVVAPWFRDTTTYGFHDWDVITSFRYLAVTSLVEHGEVPGWNPYACGGYPLWGYVEGATNVVSPWLPAYLALPLPLAIRVETLGQGLLGAAGAYVLASAFTPSQASRLLVAALWAVNGRWGLQAAAGHAWHLAYAYMPWALYFFERARVGPTRVRDVALAGGAFAMMVYAGGIYPLPHTVLLVGAYAVVMAFQDRCARPLWVLTAVGLTAVGLSAPKLLPILDTFAQDPRLVPSTERLDPGALLTLLTHREQGFFSRPARVHPYGWHEWGMYISWAGLATVVAGALLVEGRRERALKLVGAAFVLLGLGAFHPSAPWTLLHEHVPVFRSQHVPSRFLYPAVLVLALVAACGLGRFVQRWRRRRPYLDLVLALLVCAVAIDVALVAQQPMKSAMWMVPPPIPAGRTFHFEHDPPFHYRRRDWAGPMLLSMMANTGVLNCYGVPRTTLVAPGPAHVREPRYRGEAYLLGGEPARVAQWSPNRAVIEVGEHAEGATLVYNMRHRGGWSADHGQVSMHEGMIAVTLPPGVSRVTLRYRPPGLVAGMLLAAATALLLCAAAVAERGWERVR